MARKMLIDARLPEETRLAIVEGKTVEEFDIESRIRKPIKGNVYLAKVVRVEPSLQAVFVDYGGNRHGFLSFSEIHPDYYQIPVEDRNALLKAQAEAEKAEAEEAEAADAATDADADSDSTSDSPDEAEANGAASGFDSGGDDSVEEIRRRRPRVAQRRYNVQEVIKRRQIILVQVVKEERGNKGAALTAYLSLAGRYCVLMPNTSRGGGVSRRIDSATDRKRLRDTIDSLELPKGVGLIVRTAGAKRTKAEIKRDCDYLLRLWDTIRDRTMESTAPALVHEEGNLIKRAIRDLYDKTIDAIHIEGEEGYREAKDFMKMLMPSHTKNIQLDKEPEPLFQRHGIEPQLAAILDPVVQLKSGGYLVVNPTEALISIDVNSGRATREHNIEDTALKTNLEAAAAAARQIRLRDLAGLIVIDFIDMDENRNNRAVERKLQDSLKSDRARIQMGRISPFGLLEMSRQRMRTSVMETTTEPCRHCDGSGRVRSADSAALEVLRSIESQAPSASGAALVVRTGSDLALHILNVRSTELAAIQERMGVRVTIESDGTAAGRAFVIEAAAEPSEGHGAESPASRPERPERSERRTERRSERRPARSRTSRASSRSRKPDEAEANGAEEPPAQEAAPEAVEESSQDSEKESAAPRRRRVRRPRGGRRHKSASASKDSSDAAAPA